MNHYESGPPDKWPTLDVTMTSGQQTSVSLVSRVHPTVQIGDIMRQRFLVPKKSLGKLTMVHDNHGPCALQMWGTPSS
jgi:hypothetical protein